MKVDGLYQDFQVPAWMNADGIRGFVSGNIKANRSFGDNDAKPIGYAYDGVPADYYGGLAVERFAWDSPWPKLAGSIFYTLSIPVMLLMVGLVVSWVWRGLRPA